MLRQLVLAKQHFYVKSYCSSFSLIVCGGSTATDDINTPISLTVPDSLQVLETVQYLLYSAMTYHVKDVCLPVSVVYPAVGTHGMNISCRTSCRLRSAWAAWAVWCAGSKLCPFSTNWRCVGHGLKHTHKETWSGITLFHSNMLCAVQSIFSYPKYSVTVKSHMKSCCPVTQ